MSTEQIPNAEQELRQFIAEAIDFVGGVSALARIAGVSERTVYAWKKGERHPSRTKLDKLSEHFESFSPNSWQTEVPQPKWREVHERLNDPWHDLPPQTETLDDFIFVPKAQAKPSAGGGSLETSAEPEGNYAFRLDWILKRTPDTSNLCMMEVAGRSMEQTLHNGDLVLINGSDQELVEDRVYVVRLHDEIYVKRFSRTPGRYLFRGDNRELDYQDIEIDTNDEALNWEILGRVIWAGKEF